MHSLVTIWECILIPYIITFVVSLLVALIAVKYSQNSSEKNAYKQLHKNLLTEILDNIERCDHLSKLIDDDLKRSIKREESLYGLPLFYDDVCESLRIRGQLFRIATEERELYRKLKMSYEQIDMTNRLLLSDHYLYGISSLASFSYMENCILNALRVMSKESRCKAKSLILRRTPRRLNFNIIRYTSRSTPNFPF